MTSEELALRREGSEEQKESEAWEELVLHQGAIRSCPTSSNSPKTLLNHLISKWHLILHQPSSGSSPYRLERASDEQSKFVKPSF